MHRVRPLDAPIIPISSWHAPSRHGLRSLRPHVHRKSSFPHPDLSRRLPHGQLQRSALTLFPFRIHPKLAMTAVGLCGLCPRPNRPQPFFSATARSTQGLLLVARHGNGSKTETAKHCTAQQHTTLGSLDAGTRPHGMALLAHSHRQLHWTSWCEKKARKS